MLNWYYCDFRRFTVETKPHYALLGNDTIWLFIFLVSEGEVSVVAISQYKILRLWSVCSVDSPFLKWTQERDLCSLIIRGKFQSSLSSLWNLKLSTIIKKLLPASSPKSSGLDKLYFTCEVTIKSQYLAIKCLSTKSGTTVIWGVCKKVPGL